MYVSIYLSIERKVYDKSYLYMMSQEMALDTLTTEKSIEEFKILMFIGTCSVTSVHVSDLVYVQMCIYMYLLSVIHVHHK